jgi:hypothetical protein
MEIIPKNFKQVQVAFKQGRKITYGRELVNKLEKNKIQTVTKELMFKPWLPAVRIIN